MSHQLWVNKLRDPRTQKSSISPSSNDQNENIVPAPILSKSSENNLEMFVNIGLSPVAVPPFVAENNRKRREPHFSNQWSNPQLFEEIDSLDSLDGLIDDLAKMEDIDPVFQQNLILAFQLLTGEIGRHKRGYVDQIASTSIKLKQKDSAIEKQEDEKNQLKGKLDEASREIGSQKARCDILEERNKQLTETSDRQINHIKMVEEMVQSRNQDNDKLVKEIHHIKNEKLIEHAENAAENRRRCEKLGLMMKQMHDVILVKKKVDEKNFKKPKVAEPSTSSA